MKNPLHYQISEYDCGPTSMLNGISYLFEREEIPAELIRNIMIYALDCYGNDGAPGKSGTSCMAMMFLSNWLNSFGRVGKLPVHSQYLIGDQVFIGEHSRINDALKRGGAAVVRLYFDVDHYVLLTGVEGDQVLMFDPYYETACSAEPAIQVDMGQPFRYNRKVPFWCFNRDTEEIYALGKTDSREAVLLFNTKTVITAEATIEYFI